VLTTHLLHPQILGALGAAGHGSQILVADGNYPFSTGSPPGAIRVYLNLVPGVVDAVTVAAALAVTVPLEAAVTMRPDTGAEPSIVADFRSALPPGTPMSTLARTDFYQAARGADVALVIATAEQRLYGNLLLTIGVRAPDGR
jgi:L-fucose mutarotase